MQQPGVHQRAIVDVLVGVVGSRGDAFPSMSLISGARLKKSFIASQSSSRTSSLSSSSNSSSKGSSMYGASGMA